MSGQRFAVAVEEQIVATLRAASGVTTLVGNRIYLSPAPQGTPSPFLTYQLINANPIGRSYSGAVDDDTIIQVDCWADDTTETSPQSRKAQVNALAAAVRDTLHFNGLTLWTGTNDFNTPAETRRSLDFQIIVKG